MLGTDTEKEAEELQSPSAVSAQVNPPEKPAQAAEGDPSEECSQEQERKKLENVKRLKRRKLWRVFGRIGLAVLILALCIGGFFGWNYVQNQSVGVTVYRVFSQQIDEPVRLAYLTDLHQGTFGEKNQDLIQLVKQQKPDVILIGGDMLNDVEPDVNCVLDLCRELVQIAPVYYGMGNHENVTVYGRNLYKEELEAAGIEEGYTGNFSELVADSTLLDGLEACGVTVLQNSGDEIAVNGNTLLLGGLSTNADGFWLYSGRFFQSFEEQPGDCFRILLSHFPSPISRYVEDSTVDLVLSGHNHGGIVRIPGVGGLLSFDEGLLPENDAGERMLDNTTFIISRGLGNHGPVPRILNQPELVVIDLY